jgi:7,8-dihydropterin-6-yl-methyl-4-(beta-D-ribofuranosyl)aminobenzene 5'-phosphate synthase
MIVIANETVDVLLLSHWHWDHSGGITTVVAAIAAARDRAGRPPLVVDLHPDRPDQRGILTPFDNFAMLPPEPTFQAIEAAGGQVVTSADEHAVNRLFLASGDIPRQTSYETGLAGHHTWRSGRVTLDPEIHDERFLAANVHGRGTTVLTAYSHADVVNVGLEARRLRPDQPIDLLLGGYHLASISVGASFAPWATVTISVSGEENFFLGTIGGRQRRRPARRCGLSSSGKGVPRRSSVR